MACEDFPCCGHESGCCPDFDDAGNQLNMVCLCGAEVPLSSRVSICAGCLSGPDSDGFQDFDDMEPDYFHEEDEFDDR